MSIRALYVFMPSALARKQDPVLYSRCYSTVEKRANRLHGENYEALPDQQKVFDDIVCELQIFRPSSEFTKETDSCKAAKKNPIYRLPGSDNLLACAIRKNNLVFCVIPLIEDLTHVKDEIKFSKLVCLSISYTVIHSVADIVGTVLYRDDAWNSKLLELQQYLSVCMPFGTPLETSPSTVRGILGSRNQPLQKFKMPAWRPYAPKGKQTIHFTLQEHIRAVQHGKGHIDDVCEIYGSVKCKSPDGVKSSDQVKVAISLVDVEGAPEVSLNLMAPLQSAAVDQVVYHPCVLLSDDPTSTVTGIDKDDATPFAIKPVRFYLPLEQFVLCHYKAKLGGNPLPVQAYYQMKMDETAAKVLVQLKLANTMRNSFEYCNVYIPFFNKGPINNFNFIPPSSNVNVNQERSAIVWSIGQRFPKSLEVSLEGTVDFRHKQPSDNTILSDPFCSGMNSFLQISFKVADFTLSGLRVDSRSLTLLPRAKVKTSTSAELLTAEYKIWNSHGDSIYAPKPNLY